MKPEEEICHLIYLFIRFEYSNILGNKVVDHLVKSTISTDQIEDKLYLSDVIKLLLSWAKNL